MTTPNLLETLFKERGRKAKLADDLEVDRSMVTNWIKKRVPAERVLDVERVTGISRTIIRPDLYPDGPEGAQ